MYIIFNDEVDEDTIIPLMKEIREFLPEASPENPIRLFFSTVGGYMSVMYVFLQFCNEHKDVLVFDLYNSVHSAGIDILTDFRGKINLHHNTGIWMVAHNADKKVKTLSFEGYVDERKLLKFTKRHNEEQIEKFRRIGFTEKQIRTVKQGKDCVLYNEDVKLLKADNIFHIF